MRCKLTWIIADAPWSVCILLLAHVLTRLCTGFDRWAIRLRDPKANQASPRKGHLHFRGRGPPTYCRSYERNL